MLEHILKVMPQDADKDGIEDKVDKCPDDPEDFDGYEDEDGCPELDNDGDGINDTLDDLATLENILDEFTDLNQALEDGNEQLQGSIDKIPTEKEGLGLSEILLIVVLVLLVINLNNFSGRTKTRLCDLLVQIEAGYEIHNADRRPVSCREFIGMQVVSARTAVLKRTLSHG